MILRDSPYKGDATFASVLDLATPPTVGGADPGAMLLDDRKEEDAKPVADDRASKFRAEFLNLVERAMKIMQ